MKTQTYYKCLLIIILFAFNTINVAAQEDKVGFKKLEAKIIDSETNTPLIFTDIVIANSNISTVTNSDGELAFYSKSNRIIRTAISIGDKIIDAVH